MLRVSSFGSIGPVAILSREYPGASHGQALQALELLDRRRRQRHSEGNAGLGSLGGDVPDRRLGLKIQLGPTGSNEFRPPDSRQENQPDRDTRVPRSLGGLVNVDEEGGELFVIEGPLARPFGASRAKEQMRSEERRVGKECYALCRSRWSPYH